jgi:ABC-2 type transport system permease protein
MIDGFRYGFFGVSDISPWNSLVIMVCFFIVVSVIALRLLQQGYKLRH